MVTLPEDVATVAIGGITLDNVQRIIYQAQAPGKGIHGVAVVSAIMGAKDPKTAAMEFRKKIGGQPPFINHPSQTRSDDIAELLRAAPGVIAKVAQENPLCHCMINFVVANFAANALLCMYDLSPPLPLFNSS